MRAFGLEPFGSELKADLLVAGGLAMPVDPLPERRRGAEAGVDFRNRFGLWIGDR
ncbi:MAG: hypothetical protein PVG99_10245 [Desulfobacteraceae bacterium]